MKSNSFDPHIQFSQKCRKCVNFLPFTTENDTRHKSTFQYNPVNKPERLLKK